MKGKLSPIIPKQTKDTLPSLLSFSFLLNYCPNIYPCDLWLVSTSFQIPIFSTLQLLILLLILVQQDIEQLLNFVGMNSLGPRHVLANLKELFRTILSPDFITYEWYILTPCKLSIVFVNGFISDSHCGCTFFFTWAPY